MRSLANALFLSFLCVFVISTPVLFAQEPVPCETNADCIDDFFCNGWESCHPEEKVCVKVSSCPPSIDGCLVRGAYCDEERDLCVDELDASLCADTEFCSLYGECLTYGQDVGTSACGLVQSVAQNAVDYGGPYRNHGRMVRTAARTVSQFVEAAVITEECSSCIVSQFARRIPAEEQESCGLCPFNLRSFVPSPTEVTDATLRCRVPRYVTLIARTTTDSGAASVYNSLVTFGGVQGPAFSYQIGGPPWIQVGVMPDEMRACDQIIRLYSQELEDLGVLTVERRPTVDSCQLLEP